MNKPSADQSIMATRPPQERRVLLLTPTLRDSELSRAMLAEAGLDWADCRHLEELCRELQQGAGCLLIAENALLGEGIARLAAALQLQPAWSDLPVILLTRGGTGESPGLATMMEALGNMSLLEMPVRISTLFSALRAALRARARQYQIRDQMLAQQKDKEALSAGEERYRALINASAQVLYRMSPDWSEMRQLDSRGFLATTDRPGLTWLQEYIYPEDWPHVSAAIHEAIRTKSLFELEHRVRRKDGTVGWTSSRAVPLLGAAGEIVEWFGSATDITERKQAEEQLAAAKLSADQAKAAAEMANRSKDHFLAVLSHELRTPLTPVVMGVSMLKDKPNLDTNMRETLEMIGQNVEMEARLIDDLLDVTRIARGKIEMNRGPVELCKVIRLAVEVCRPDLEARKLHFDIDWGPAPLYWVEADASRLQQVFWNLLKNAIKFTPHGGCVGIRCQTSNEHVIIEVNDSGIGIEPGSLSVIFDAFEQTERSATRQFGGLGLGLAISKALVELHGGQIEAHSKGINQGATFRIRLPLSTPAITYQAPISAKPMTSSVGLLRILLVEDHGVTARMIQMVLTEKGHSVEIAGDVSTALALADRETFDLLLSDLGLPDGSGHDLIRELRTRGHGFPGIALSGYGQEEDIHRSYQAGFATHLIKPTSREMILETVAAVAAGNRHPTPD